MYSTGRPTEDADSRTIFVNNVMTKTLRLDIDFLVRGYHSLFLLQCCYPTQVHFAATKDNLSRHFNKFGDVLKVGIVTDATTGQPKG